MGKKEGDKTFKRITNSDIFEEIQKLKKDFASFQIGNAIEHSQMLVQQATTNGKVKTNRWIASTALTLCFVILGLILK